MSYGNYDGEVDFSELRGETIVNVETDDNEFIIFHCASGNVFKMYHMQNCCESVAIEDVAGGTLHDLVGQEIIEAYESSNSDNPKARTYGDDVEYTDDSCTWTFYTIRTMNTTLTIRWYGSSNGYYSESVNFIKFAIAHPEMKAFRKVGEPTITLRKV